jgi:SPP1 gp7 family putative phage head morphogenesis protein
VPLSARHVAELRVRRALTLVRARRPPRRKQAPPARWPRAARLTYFAELKALLADLRAGLDRLLMPQLPRLLALVEANKPRLDSADDLKRELDRINDLTDDLLTTERVRRMADKVAQQVSDFNKGEVNRQFRSVLGIDLLHGEPYLQQQLGMFADDNARLITTLAQEHLDQVAGIVMRAARSGQRVEDLRDELQARFSITESKAELLARDQVGKLNGELTQLRHQSVGVSEYEWSTSRDERVRSRHAELEGTTHAWDDPPVVDERTGRRAHPGQDIQCRCTAIPKVDDLLDALGADPEVQPEPKQPAPPPPVEQPAPAPTRGVPFVLPDIEPTRALA